MEKLLICRPENNLANRLITILSAYRIAKLYNLRFVLVWNTDADKSCVFQHCFTSLFHTTQFEVIKEIPPSITVVRPYVDPNKGRLIVYQHLLNSTRVDGILIEGWHHFALTEQDLISDAQQITVEMRELGCKLFTPSKEVEEFGKLIGRDLSTKYDCGVHYRSGALTLNDSELLAKASPEQFIKLISKISGLNSFKTAFVTGSSQQINFDLAKAVSRLEIKTILSSAQDFTPGFFSHSIAILDFLALANCKIVINSGATTFSALAALLGDSQELITSTGPFHYFSRRPIIGSGLGL